MSRYSGGGDYHRDRRDRSPPRFGDRRPSYNEPPRAPRGRELRDAPPLGRPREFQPREGDAPRPRRNSRDGPLSVGPTYSDPSSFRGGFGRGRGRGDDARGGRGGRRFDDRESFSRDRSPPPRWARDDRSPPRRDDRRFDRREDGRWNDYWPDREREREPDRWRDASANSDSRNASDAQTSLPQTAANVNPERLALIEDGNQDFALRRASTISIPPQGSRLDIRREADPPYLGARNESAGNKYPPRAASPPAQPPPVPAFTLSFAPAAQPKPELKIDLSSRQSEASPAGTGAQNSPVVPRLPRPVSAVDPPRAPKALEPDQESGARLQNARSWESLSSAGGPARPPVPQTRSPVVTSTTRVGDIIAPTGPKAARTASHSSHSPRPPFAEPFGALPRSRTPPLAAPSGPRAHAASRSPEIGFASGPTGPKVDRGPPAAPRAQDRANGMSRPNERPAIALSRQPPSAPRVQSQGWNLWRRDTAPSVVTKREHDEQRQDPRGSEFNVHRQQVDARTPAATSAVKRAVSPPKGHSAQQSFFGQPASDRYDELASDVADDSIDSSDDDDEIEVEDLALFEAKFKRKQRELEAKLVDLSAREYRSTTPLETIARLARVTMADVERFKERDVDMDTDEPPPRARPGAPTTQSSGSDEVDIPTPTGEENNSVIIHNDDDAEEDLRRVYHPAAEVISLPYMTRASHTGQDLDLNTMLDAQQKEVELRLQTEARQDEDYELQLADQFGKLYAAWRLECEELDVEREKQEQIERQLSLEPNPELEATPSTASNPVFEGRRPHRFASEYEIELIMKQSEETARLEQEKADREAKRVQADMDKEAELPDQLRPRDFAAQSFVDENRLRDPASLTIVFAYEPAIDNFTEEEQQIFVAAFKETPKKWTEIASLLPGREPKDCIRHYYANKWDGRFRLNKKGRIKANRRGRGGRGPRGRVSAMGDLAGGEELPVAISDSGRPKRAAAPVSFHEKESEAKAALSGQSPAKRAVKQEGPDGEKPAKRRKGNGDKPPRKAKGSQHLAQIAAAPIMSPEGRPLQIVQQHDQGRSRAMEEASLLTGFHAGRPSMSMEQQAIYGAHDKYGPRMYEDSERLRGPLHAASSSAKPSPSSYWSVPEQSDFIKYIAYFGTDFAAIAAHMGTKTQTMIKNHYQRQIEGSHPELQQTAFAANAARQRGETVGAPPTPTPITKRKYDSAATITQSRIVPQGEPMDLDEPGLSARPALNKHESPHQFSVRPQYPPATAPTSQEPHAGPSLASQEHSGMAGQSGRTYQSGRQALYEARGERASVSGAPNYYPPASVAAGPPPQHRGSHEQHDMYIQGLLDEQRRAIRLQDQHGQDQEPMQDPYYPRQQIQHRSPHMHHLQAAQHERRPFGDHRPNTPPASYFPARSTASDGARKMSDRSAHLLDPIRFPPPTPQVIPSPPKRDPGRPSAPAFASVSNKPAAPEAPKRMDLFSMLNNTEESKPKRSSLDLASSGARAGSPAQHTGLSASPYSTLSRPRESYAQPAQSQYAAPRPAVAHPPPPSRSPAPPPTLKQETSGPAKHDWPPRSSMPGLPPQQPVPLEREVRPYYSHRASLLSQGEARANPSPPPHTGLPHSRAASGSEAPARSYSGGAPSVSSAVGSGSTMYAPPAYSHGSALPGTAAHHAPISNPYASIHQRGTSRDDAYHREQMIRESEREREEREWRYQRDRDEAAERQRMEHDRHYARSSGPPLQAPAAAYSMPYESSAARMPNPSMSLREQSTRDAELAMQQQEERIRQGTLYGGREREQPQAVEDARRRHDDAFLPASRRTPLGGAYGGPSSLSGTGRR